MEVMCERVLRTHLLCIRISLFPSRNFFSRWEEVFRRTGNVTIGVRSFLHLFIPASFLFWLIFFVKYWPRLNNLSAAFSASLNKTFEKSYGLSISVFFSGGF